MAGLLRLWTVATLLLSSSIVAAGSADTDRPNSRSSSDVRLSTGAGWTFVSGIASRRTSEGSDNIGFSASVPAEKSVYLPAKGGKVVVEFTAQDGDVGAAPHQAVLSLSRPGRSGVSVQYVIPVQVSATGLGRGEITAKGLPVPFSTADETEIEVSLLLGSFGPSAGLNRPIFRLVVETDKSTSSSPSASSDHVRFQARPEIRHEFKAEAKSPPTVVSLFFSALVIGLFGGFIILWTTVLGANVDQAKSAFETAPVAHAGFVTSVVGLEGGLVMYYHSWTLFQTLPVLAIGGVIAVVAGSRALSEVQARRLAGNR